MDPNFCYIYVQGWKTDTVFQDRARAAADAAPMRECVIVPSSAEWPSAVPAPPASDCATIICGCGDRPRGFVDDTAGNYRIRATFLRVEGEC